MPGAQLVLRGREFIATGIEQRRKKNCGLEKVSVRTPETCDSQKKMGATQSWDDRGCGVCVLQGANGLSLFPPLFQKGWPQFFSCMVFGAHVCVCVCEPEVFDACCF